MTRRKTRESRKIRDENDPDLSESGKRTPVDIETTTPTRERMACPTEKKTRETSPTERTPRKTSLLQRLL